MSDQPQNFSEISDSDNRNRSTKRVNSVVGKGLTDAFDVFDVFKSFYLDPLSNMLGEDRNSLNVSNNDVQVITRWT